MKIEKGKWYKGYALPWTGRSVEELVNRGEVKLKGKTKVMRQIKFRGLRTDGKGWVYGVPLHNSKITVIVTRILDTGYKMCEYIEVIPESVGQFTGLHDKNGVKIYEGDVFKIDQTVNGVSTFAILHCIGGYDVRYYYENKPQREYEYSIYELLDIDETEKEIEVIGNIHETK